MQFLNSQGNTKTLSNCNDCEKSHIIKIIRIEETLLIHCLKRRRGGTISWVGSKWGRSGRSGRDWKRGLSGIKMHCFTLSIKKQKRERGKKLTLIVCSIISNVKFYYFIDIVPYKYLHYIQMRH